MCTVNTGTGDGPDQLFCDATEDGSLEAAAAMSTEVELVRLQFIDGAQHFRPNDAHLDDRFHTRAARFDESDKPLHASHDAQL